MPTEVQIYKDATIVAADLADKTITATKIADKTIAAAQIADTTITAAQIADDTITAGKLSTGHPTWDANGNLTASSFVKTGGTSSQYLMADGSTTTTFFAAGTTLLFYQAAAPTGWTKVTTHDNKTLRVVSGTGGGSGGSTNFTTVFKSRTDIPLPQHTHPWTNTGSNYGAPAPGNMAARTSPGISAAFGGGYGIGDVTFSIDNAGTATPTMDFAVQYIDVILCSKA